MDIQEKLEELKTMVEGDEYAQVDELQHVIVDAKMMHYASAALTGLISRSNRSLQEVVDRRAVFASAAFEIAEAMVKMESAVRSMPEGDDAPSL